MEDRYLFKAKIKENNNTGYKELDWIIGNLVVEQSTGRHFIIDLSHFDENTKLCDVMIEVDPSTICQCTGLKDKNGNLIWENDIVAYWDSYSTENGLAEADCIGKVVWDDETISFQVTNRLSAESYEVLGDECSVIGNVFDNPELLEV